MIRVHIKRGFDDKISSFTMEGHADFANKGEDIVCAGASAVAFGSVNSIIALTGIEPDIEQSQSGFLKCSIPNNLPKETAEQVQLLLKGMIVSLQTIEREYSSYINISFEP